MKVCSMGLSLRKDNFPAALLSCSERKPRGPTVPAIAATTDKPSAKSPRRPSTNDLGTIGIRRLRGLKGKPFCDNKEKVIVTVVATNAHARKPQCKKLTAKDGSTASGVPPIESEK